MPQRPHREPERSCVACRTKRPKRALIRLVFDAAGRLAIDARGRAPGRGAYLCAEPDCWRRAVSGRPLSQALRRDLDEADRALLQAGPPGRRDAPRSEAETDARYPIAGETTP